MLAMTVRAYLKGIVSNGIRFLARRILLACFLPNAIDMDNLPPALNFVDGPMTRRRSQRREATSPMSIVNR